MLTVIKGSKKEKLDYFLLHLNAFANAISKHERTNSRLDLYKMVYHGVKVVCLQTGHATDLENANARFQFISMVKTLIGYLTPIELQQIFPIDKTYDGIRWECKDHFYVKEALLKYAPDESIGEENVSDLLWDYMNHDTRMFLVNLWNTVDDTLVLQGEKSSWESFCEDNDITTYTTSTDKRTGKQFMTNNDTGETVRVHKPKPKHLNVVEGGLTNL